jgi:hypothetical protein
VASQAIPRQSAPSARPNHNPAKTSSNPATPTGGTASAAATAPSGPTAAATNSGDPGFIADARWVENSKGWTLEVTPTAQARAAKGDYEAGVRGWDELEAHYPDERLVTYRETLRNQYICHQQFATIAEPDKPTWNLELWRQDVPYALVVVAACNPGGPE